MKNIIKLENRIMHFNEQCNVSIECGSIEFIIRRIMEMSKAVSIKTKIIDKLIWQFPKLFFKIMQVEIRKNRINRIVHNKIVDCFYILQLNSKAVFESNL